MYRTRNPEASPFYKLVRDHFDEFERVYDGRFQPKYGYWRPVIRTAIDKFLECGDLREGFARIRCPDCGKEFFVAFSCRSRPAGLPILRSEAGAVAGYATGGGGVCDGSAPAMGGVENMQTGTFMKQRRMSWAALIKKVYEVDPLHCPECGGTMKIISFIEKCQPPVVEKILRPCGLWKEAVPRSLPQERRVAEHEQCYDYGYFDRVCI